jgi:hypothetical protein
MLVAQNLVLKLGSLTSLTLLGLVLVAVPVSRKSEE